MRSTTAVATFEAEPVPVSMGAGGQLRVGASGVQLEQVLEAFDQGLTAQSIVERYRGLDLADVHIVLGWYLRHREEVAKVKQAAEDFRQGRGRPLEAVLAELGI